MILENVQMPELEVGDYFKFNRMGAYTNAAASRFNGIVKPMIHYYRDGEKLELEKDRLKKKNCIMHINK